MPRQSEHNQDYYGTIIKEIVDCSVGASYESSDNPRQRQFVW